MNTATEYCDLSKRIDAAWERINTVKNSGCQSAEMVGALMDLIGLHAEHTADAALVLAKANDKYDELSVRTNLYRETLMKVLELCKREQFLAVGPHVDHLRQELSKLNARRTDKVGTRIPPPWNSRLN